MSFTLADILEMKEMAIRRSKIDSLIVEIDNETKKLLIDVFHNDNITKTSDKQKLKKTVSFKDTVNVKEYIVNNISKNTHQRYPNQRYPNQRYKNQRYPKEKYVQRHNQNFNEDYII